MTSKIFCKRWPARDCFDWKNLTFEKDGRSIAYRKASLTQEGEELPPTDPLDFVLPDSSNQVVTTRKKSDEQAKREKYLFENLNDSSAQVGYI